MIVKKHISLFIVLFLWNFTFTQYDDGVEYINNSNPEIQDNSEYFFEEETNPYENYKSHQEYLKSDLKKEELDWIEWQKIKKSIVEGYPESDYYVSEDGKNLENKDNPFHKSKNQNKNYWENKRKNHSKTYKEKRLAEKERKKREEKKKRENSQLNLGSSFGVFLLIIIIALLAFLIFQMFFKNKPNQGKKGIVYDLENISPSKIPKSELELLLEKSIEEENYREAIRIYFVFTIKSLVKYNLIQWEKEKTNLSYLYEMRGHPNFNLFEEVVNYYEIIWYGEREILKLDFKKIEPKFLKLLKKLEK